MRKTATALVLVVLGAGLAGAEPAPAKKAEAPKGLEDAIQIIRAQQEDLARLRASLKKEVDRNQALLKETAALRDRTVAAEIVRRTALDRTAQLEKQVAELARELARARAGAGPVRVGKAPPPNDVEGLVKRIDEKTGLFTIDVGSDAGLAVGHTLEVFRLKPTPKYLGTASLVGVAKKESVAKMQGRAKGPLQIGDQVASRILPR